MASAVSVCIRHIKATAEISKKRQIVGCFGRRTRSFSRLLAKTNAEFGIDSTNALACFSLVKDNAGIWVRTQ